MQKLLTLIIMGVILYMLIEDRIFPPKTPSTSAVNDQTDTPAVANNTTDKTVVKDEQLGGNFIEKTVSKVLINVLKTEEGKIFFENILQPSNKPLAGAEQSYKINNINFINSLFKITTFGEGTIGPASCGHVVTINYKILSLENIMVEENTKTYTLGFKPIIPGLDNIIVGMMVGQTRQGVVPAKYAYLEEKYRKNNVDPEGYYKVSVTLQNLMPANYVKDDEVKIYDDEIAYKMPLLCGDMTSFDAKITKLSSGQVLYDSSTTGKKLSIMVGDINYPLIFGYSLYGKIPIGTRTVIAKGKAFKGLGATTTKVFPNAQLPDNEYFMLELNNFNNQ